MLCLLCTLRRLQRYACLSCNSRVNICFTQLKASAFNIPEPPPQEADQEAPPVPPNTSASLDDNQAIPEEQPSAEQSTLEPLPPLRATPSVQVNTTREN